MNIEDISLELYQKMEKWESRLILTTTTLILLGLTIGCTEAEWDKNVGKLGVSAKITCYSGGKIIFEDESTGAISSPHNSDGWAYRSKKNGKYREISADCILTYED